MMFGREDSRSGRVILTEVSRVIGVVAVGATFRDCCRLENNCLGLLLACPNKVRTVRLCGIFASSSSSDLIGAGDSSSFETCSSIFDCASLPLTRVLRASSRSTRVFATFWNASTLACRALSSGEMGRVDELLPPLDASMSMVAVSMSFSSAFNESYELSSTRLEMVAWPVGGDSLARLESASPEELRAVDEEMRCDRMDGCVS